jgi:hypothetical protein
LSVFEWHRRFKEGREDVQDDPKSGKAKMQKTDANVDTVQTNSESTALFGSVDKVTVICLEEKTRTLTMTMPLRMMC